MNLVRPWDSNPQHLVFETSPTTNCGRGVKHWCAWRGSNFIVRGTLVSETKACIPKFQHTRRKTKKEWYARRDRTRRTLVLSQVRLPIASLAQKHGLERWLDSPTRRAQRPLYQLSLPKRKLGAPSRIRTCASSSCEPQRHARGAALLDYSTAGNPGLSGDLPISIGAKCGGCVGNRTPAVPALVGSFALMLLRLLTVHVRSSGSTPMTGVLKEWRR